MEKLKKLYSLDLRSLGLFRILLGLLFVLDVFNKLYWAREFYTDWGLFPRAVWIADFMSSSKISLHLLSGDLFVIYILLAIHLLAALAYLLGYRAKLAGWVLFISTCSLQSRNNLILSSADDLLRMALFWSLFLPIQKRFSLATQDLKEPAKNNAIANLPALAFSLQLLVMYLATAIFKKHSVWTTEGAAVYYALNLDLYVKSLAHYFREKLFFTQLLTWATLALEALGPFVFFMGPYGRSVTALLFMFFHFSLFMFIELGLFPWVAIVYWLGVMPPLVWRTKFGIWLETELHRGFAKLQAKLSLQKSIPVKPLSDPWISKTQRAYFLICFSLMMWTNASPWLKSTREIDKNMNEITDRLYINQRWDMFSPYPIRNDGWFVIVGQFENGAELDLSTQKPVTFAKPELISASFPNGEWRKFMVNVWDRSDKKILLPFARYLCRKNSLTENGSSSVKTFQIHFIKERTPPIGEVFARTEKVTLWTHQCF